MVAIDKNVTMYAEIITIGDEILIGQVVDTNSAFLAMELNKLGIEVVQITSVPDSRLHIMQALDNAISRAQLVICTGGLGPTADDITKPALADYFGCKLVSNEAVLRHIQTLLEARGVIINKRNIRQAELPESCEVLHNSAGTAQGMWFRKNGCDIISLPGVPYEMKAIFYEELEMRFRERYTLPPILHHTLLTHGLPESKMADLIHDWETNLPSEIRLAYLPSPGILRLRLTGRTAGSIEELKIRLNQEVEKLTKLIYPFIFGSNDDRLETLVGGLLIGKNQTLSLAESCTGGTISAMITSIPGSSRYFKGGIVAYSNEIKTAELNVSPYTLMMNGAVSQAVVEQMADGIRRKFQTDYAVSVSGIAGPDGATDDKPVGTTWIAVASERRIIARVHNFGDERSRNIQKAAIAALFMLREEIMNCL